MVEPLSIATACVGLISGIATLLLQLNAFISTTRDAPTKMRGVSEELTSLRVSVESLRANSNVVHYPAGMQESLVLVLTNCDSVTRDMSAMLGKMSSMKLARKIQWTVSGQRDMNKLRFSLESHKSALNIALGLTAIHMIAGPRANQPEQIQPEQTHQIAALVQEIALLRLQVDCQVDADGRDFVLNRFLAETGSYADTVVDASPYQEPEGGNDEIEKRERPREIPKTLGYAVLDSAIASQQTGLTTATDPDHHGHDYDYGHKLGLAAMDEDDRRVYGVEKKPSLFQRIFKRKENGFPGESEYDEDKYVDIPHDYTPSGWRPAVAMDNTAIWTYEEGN